MRKAPEQHEDITFEQRTLPSKKQVWKTNQMMTLIRRRFHTGLVQEVECDADQWGFPGSESENPGPRPTTAVATAHSPKADTGAA